MVTHLCFLLMLEFLRPNWLCKVELSARAVVRPIRRAGHSLVGIHVRRTDYIQKVSTATSLPPQSAEWWSSYAYDDVYDNITIWWSSYDNMMFSWEAVRSTQVFMGRQWLNWGGDGVNLSFWWWDLFPFHEISFHSMRSFMIWAIGGDISYHFMRSLGVWIIGEEIPFIIPSQHCIIISMHWISACQGTALHTNAPYSIDPNFDIFYCNNIHQDIR